jgi:hypothetical protein
MLRGVGQPAIIGMSVARLAADNGYELNGLWFPPLSIDPDSHEAEDFTLTDPPGAQYADRYHLDGSGGASEAAAITVTGQDSATHEAIALCIGNIDLGDTTVASIKLQAGRNNWRIDGPNVTYWGDEVAIHNEHTPVAWNGDGSIHTIISVGFRRYLDGTYWATGTYESQWGAAASHAVSATDAEVDVRAVVSLHNRASNPSNEDADALAADLHALLIGG